MCVCLWLQVREGAMSDLQTQLREVLRENELLRRDVSYSLLLQLMVSCFALVVLVCFSGNPSILDSKESS